MSWDIPITPFIVGLLGLVVTPGATVLIVWLLVRNSRWKRAEQHEERMAMIERGLITTRTTRYLDPIVEPDRKLKRGITFTAIGMAVTLWALFIEAGPGTIFGLVPLFLGVSWIVPYLIAHQANLPAQAEYRASGSEKTAS